MSKAEEIMNKEISDDEKLDLMKVHFHECGEYTDKKQTIENTNDYFEQLKEILGYIVELQK